jgi:hypothetical protein
MDAGFKSGMFPGFTLAELVAKVAAGQGSEKMAAEIARRQAVAAGDMSKASDGERLHAAMKKAGV